MLDDDFTRGTYVLDAGERVVSVWSQVIGEPLGTEEGSASIRRVRIPSPSRSEATSEITLSAGWRSAATGVLLPRRTAQRRRPRPGRPKLWEPARSATSGKQTLDGRGTAPVLSSDHGTAFVATAAGTLSAFDAADPAGGASTYPLRWKASLGGPVTARPALSADGLVVATTTGTVAVFDPEGCGAAACSPTWTTTVPGAVTEQPTIAGGLVYVASAATHLGPTTVSAFPVSCTTGCSPLWSVDTGLVLSGPVVVSDRGRVFASGSVAGATGPVSRVIAYRPA